LSTQDFRKTSPHTAASRFMLSLVIGHRSRNPLPNCGKAAIEQESGESSEESTKAACSPAVYLLLSDCSSLPNCGKAAIEQESGESSEESKKAACSPLVYSLLSIF
jgi:hypothetical protein